jgi:tripartite-type tricarboxylate transporter receptor subunit TctC
MKKLVYIASMLSFACMALPSFASSDDKWPDKPVRFIVPFPAGGATDATVRLLANRLQKSWGQPVIVENKAGAGTIISTDYVAKSKPDGYTMGVVVTPHVVNPSMRSSMPYDTLKDLSGVTQIAFQHLVMAAHPSFEANTMAELIALAKKNPGKITYATPGSGTAMHLAVELLKTTVGIDLVHVPYKGGAPATQDVMGGQVPLLLDVYSSSAPYINTGKLKAIAMLSPKRSAAAPQIPAIAETVPTVSAVSILGVAVPSATPRKTIETANADIVRELRSPEFSAKLREAGLEPVGSTPQAFDELIRTEIAKWAPVVKASGAKID